MKRNHILYKLGCAAGAAVMLMGLTSVAWGQDASFDRTVLPIPEPNLPHSSVFDDAADVGDDEGTPVTEDYKAYDNKFTGKIAKVTIELDEMKAADREEAEQGHHVAAVKKGLSD